MITSIYCNFEKLSFEKIFQKGLLITKKMMKQFPRGNFEQLIDDYAIEMPEFYCLPGDSYKVSLSSCVIEKDEARMKKLCELMQQQMICELKEKGSMQQIWFENSSVRIYFVVDKSSNLCKIVCENIGEEFQQSKFEKSYLPYFWKCINETYDGDTIELVVKFNIYIIGEDFITNTGSYGEVVLSNKENIEFPVITTKNVKPIKA